MKKILTGVAIIALCSNLLYAGEASEINLNGKYYVSDNSIDNINKMYEEMGRNSEARRRSALSTEERNIEDMEKDNELKRRQKAAEKEAYEQKSFSEKAKSWFN